MENYYSLTDEKIIQARKRAQKLCVEYNEKVNQENFYDEALLNTLLKKVGRDPYVEPNFRCFLGSRIELGDEVFLNHDVTLQDMAEIERVVPGLPIIPARPVATARYIYDVATDEVEKFEWVMETARQAIYIFCEESLKQYTKGTLRANEFRNTQMSMSVPMLRAYHNNNVYPGKDLELQVTYRNTPTLKVRIYQNLSNPASAMRKQKGFRGKLVKEVAFMGVRTPLVVTGMALSIVASIVLIVLHYVGFLVIRGSSSLKFDAIFYPWAPFNVMLAHGEMYFGVLAFLEECLPLNEKWYCIGFSIACLLVANPGCVAMCLIRPLFQDVHDSVHLATLLMIGMAMAIVMDLHWITDQVKPSLVFVFMVLLFVVFMTVFQFIVKRRVKK